MQRTLATLYFALLPTPALALDVTCASSAPLAQPGNAPSVGASLSADGRFVVFESGAWNLVSGDVNDGYDVFVHDRVTGVTELMSSNMAGGVSIYGAQGGVISNDGRCVAFVSFGEDFTTNDQNGWQDVFVRDRLSGTIECISVDPTNASGNHNSTAPALSGDARFVAFVSRATSLRSGLDQNGFVDDVFVRDRQTGVTRIASVSDNGSQGNQPSRAPTLSADGRFVAFETASNGLVPSDTNGGSDVFVRDLVAGTTVRVSVASGGAQANGASVKACLSGDGRFVAFESFATNLVPGDTNGTWDVYVRDLVLGVTVRASLDSNGNQGVGHAFLPRLDHTGRYLAFETDDPFDPTDTNGYLDVFVRDLALGTTQRVSVTSTGQDIASTSFFPALSADGSTVSFTSAAAGVVPGDTNATEDVFVSSWRADWSSACFGDGTGSACPCANHSPLGAQAGCTHSLGTGGRLSAVGAPSVGNDTFVLVGSSMPNGPVLYFQSSALQSAGIAFGDGLLCASGSFARLGVRFNALGASHHPGPADVPISIAGSCTPGAQPAYQAWYRDAAPFCTSVTFNVTNAVVTTWRP